MSIQANMVAAAYQLPECPQAYGVKYKQLMQLHYAPLQLEIAQDSSHLFSDIAVNNCRKKIYVLPFC